MNRKALIAIGAVLVAMAIPVVVWKVQGANMRAGFVEALRAGTVRGLHRDLQGKEWTEAELAEAQVLSVPDSAGPQQSIARHVHSGGRIYVSPIQYGYQGTAPDYSTGIVHVFGYRSGEPAGWCWAMIHPSSMAEHVQRRVEQLEAMKGQQGR